MIVERLKELCDEKGVSFIQFERESGIGINTAKRWDTNAPNVWKVKQAADYFGVTVSYIIGETNKKTAVQMDDGMEKDKDSVRCPPVKAGHSAYSANGAIARRYVKRIRLETSPHPDRPPSVFRQ